VVVAVAAAIFAGSALPERSIHNVVDPLVRVVRPDAETRLLAPWRRRAKNAAHLLEYALLAVVVARAIRPRTRRRGTALLLALGLTAAYAGTDELHQTLNPGRTARLSDWALDVAGASAGLASLILCERVTGTSRGTARRAADQRSRESRASTTTNSSASA
jgi:VanZ family protein